MCAFPFFDFLDLPISRLDGTIEDIQENAQKTTCQPEFHSGGLTPGSLMPQSPHLGAVPFFLMWR